MVASTLIRSLALVAFQLSYVRAVYCPAGTYQSGNSCISCSPGSYTKEANQKKCTAARKGYYIPGYGATAETPCSKGTYNDVTGASECKSCPAGSMCPSTALTQPQLCSPGRYSTGGAIDCTWCPPGYFNSVQGATGCCACCAGWFNANSALTNCQKCSNQYPYSSPGSTSCTNHMGIYSPMSSCSMNGRRCPLTFIDDPSQMSWRRDEDSGPKCPNEGEKACPVYKTEKGIRRKIGYTCKLIANDLWSCGGCPNYDKVGNLDGTTGKDCTEIPNVDSVECVNGRCIIQFCRSGYMKSDNKTACIPAYSPDSLILQSRHGLHAKRHL